MNITNVFAILLHTKMIKIIKIILLYDTNLNNVYTFKLLLIRNHQINNITQSYYHSNTVQHRLNNILQILSRGLQNIKLKFNTNAYLYRPMTKIINITNNIELLIKLTCINIYSNLLITLPKELGLLTKLNIFICNHNQLLTIPTELRLNNLKLLNVRQNKLTHIPFELDNLYILNTGNKLIYIRQNILFT